jgi:hypothetical protein
MAMAAERIVVPALLRGEPLVSNQAAYSTGLCMALTSHSKGWFRDFGQAHYPEVKDCDVDMAAKVLADGRIKPGGARRSLSAAGGKKQASTRATT